MEEFLRVGVVTSPHGVHGEVKVFPTTDEKERFQKLEKVFLDLGGEKRELAIAGVKFFKNLVILRFRGLERPEDVEGFRQKDLLIERSQAVPLGEDENFIADLIGLTVRTDAGEILGTMADVMETGANDVYCVKTETGREVLLPATKECILRVDLEKQEMLVHVLPGLLEL